MTCAPRLSFGTMRVALHESAHTVTAHLLGVPYTHVTVAIDLHAGSLGALHVTPEPINVRDGVIVLLAGGQAEIKLCGHVSGNGDRDDIQAAREGLSRALHVPPSDPLVDVELAHCREDAASAVENNWRWILAVAAALRRQRVLRAEAIEQLRVASGCGRMERNHL
jgi:hypothetical protein